MTDLSRRRFLKLSAGATAASVLTPAIARAAAIEGNHAARSIHDVEHVVVLMQENRSFDHYFGTLRGVRGYGDPHPARLRNGKNVFHQPSRSGEVLPFHPKVDDLGLAFLEDLDHGWEGGHDALNHGRYDKWVPVKTAATMAHLTRDDIPFHYALADAFTICDAYHCSLLGPTDPNRYFQWTGSCGGAGKGGGPVIANDELGYSWTTYPERLQHAGVSWKVYQDAGLGLSKSGFWGWTSDPYIGNYGDNSLLYFDQYRSAKSGEPLHERARRGTNATKGQSLFAHLRADVAKDTLPAVSWVVAPEAYTEHPNWPANYGAWYIAHVLDALTSNPDVWSKTALFITYDENDGFFDHVVPPYAPVDAAAGASTVDPTLELFDGKAGTKGGSDGTPGPYGLGQRVPMLVVSPWSKGGFVASEVFDHTSIIRFMEQRFGVHEPNISPWRRAVCGDLTSAFDFAATDTSMPALPGTAGYAPPDRDRHPDVVAKPPKSQSVPQQEKGLRPTRPVPYDVGIAPTVTSTGLSLRLVNNGSRAAVFHVRKWLADQLKVQMFTVGGERSLRTTVAAGTYHVEVHAPNGWYRRFAGRSRPGVEATLHLTMNGMTLVLDNAGAAADVTVADRYTATGQTVRVARGAQVRLPVTLRHGWYGLTVTSSRDATFERLLAGRVPSSEPGLSDPALGR